MLLYEQIPVNDRTKPAAGLSARCFERLGGFGTRFFGYILANDE